MTDYIENETTNPSEPEETREPDCYKAALHLTGRSLACEETIYLGFFSTKELAVRAGNFARDNFSEFYPGRKCAIDFQCEKFIAADTSAYLAGLSDESDHKHTKGHNMSLATVYSDWFDYMSSHSSARAVLPTTSKRI